jgi:hypothetical protein
MGHGYFSIVSSVNFLIVDCSGGGFALGSALMAMAASL